MNMASFAFIAMTSVLLVIQVMALVKVLHSTSMTTPPVAWALCLRLHLRTLVCYMAMVKRVIVIALENVARCGAFGALILTLVIQPALMVTMAPNLPSTIHPLSARLPMYHDLLAQLLHKEYQTILRSWRQRQIGWRLCTNRRKAVLAAAEALGLTDKVLALNDAVDPVNSNSKLTTRRRLIKEGTMRITTRP